jgi:Zn ribbon nucleic-acid-binding protein
MSASTCRGGNFAAAGRSPSCRDKGLIRAWLEEFVDSADCFSYTTNREITATNKQVLCSGKYQQLFRSGKQASSTWAFCVKTMSEVLQEIAKDMGEAS